MLKFLMSNFICLLYRNLQVQNMEVEKVEKSRDRTASAYSAQYPTHGVPVSKNGVREDVKIVMQVSVDSCNE